MPDHLVRIGALGQIGRFQAADAASFPRGHNVICRTSRGLEYGTVLNSVHNENAQVPRTGTILRRATPEDHLLWARVEKNRLAAFRACERLLADRLDFSQVTLMDVELLFDGKSIFFYFLGNTTAALTEELESVTSELADAYEAKVQLKKFAEAMALGCGPDCGTGDSCGDGTGCGSCSIASACNTKATTSTAAFQDNSNIGGSDTLPHNNG